MFSLPRVLGCLLFSAALAVGEDFDGEKAGALSSLDGEFGAWTAARGHAEIISGHGRSGEQSLRLLGGDDRGVSLELKSALTMDVELSFWAERWTSGGPFKFRVEAKQSGGWKEIYNGDRLIKVGGFHTEVFVPVAKGTTAIRFSSTTPSKSGVMLDDLHIGKSAAMEITSSEVVQPVIPVMKRLEQNGVASLRVMTEGRGAPKKVTALKVSLEGTTNLGDVKSVQVIHTGAGYDLAAGTPFGEEQDPAAEMVFTGEQVLVGGENNFWISVELDDHANIDGRVDAGVLGLQIDGKGVGAPTPASPEGAQRIGVAVPRSGDGGSKRFRIPGLATTNKGTLIGVYDMRYSHGHDLPGDIDVAMNRSKDGGQSWEPLKVIMDMGNDKKWHYDGIGDPAVLVDRSNNRIWVIATWSHGNRSWRGSGKGMTPEETGQLMLVYSDDDGVTWSKEINITKQVKDPDWHFLLQGPGKGITMKNGTIVFPAQFQDGSSKRMPYSSLIYSKDHGETWHMGTGIKSNTTEAQLVELGDGSLMLNCRDNRGGSRTIGVTKDMGATWEMHPTDRKALNEPVCMASLIRVEHPKHGDVLMFSNPNTRRGRNHMTVKVSKDEGVTWPEEMHTLYDMRGGAGYSCMTQIGEDYVGVLYEGIGQLYFMRFPIDELVQ